MIVLNLGGEMLYILNQRLQAQNIAEEKARKVLQDVVKAMFSPSFIEELFKPQAMYTLAATKQIFEKLAHSSIMRLNQSSMDKLFDLMTMGFKYQVLQCCSPQQYLHLLLLHLESIKALLGRGSVSDLAQTAIEMAIQTYAPFSMGNWIQLKQAIFRMVQGKRIKVSLFLQHRMQGLDGNLVLDFRGKLPFGTNIPGTIAFYENSSLVSTKPFNTEFTERYVTESKKFLDAESAIGGNMYSKTYHPDVKTSDPVQSTIQALDAIENMSGIKTKSGRPPASKSSAKLELNLLADMLGLSSSESSSEKSVPWRVNLFPDTNADSKHSQSNTFDNETFIMLDIDGAADSKSVNDYLDKFQLDSIQSDSKADDLLSLMDSSK